MTEEQKTENVFCNHCHRDTEHNVVKFGIDNSEYSLETAASLYNEPCYVGMSRWYQILQCRGCKQVSLLISEIFSEFEYNCPATIKRYPAEKHLIEPQWIDHLPPQITNVLREVYTAIQYECFTLVSIGIRTVFDLGRVIS